ncbi:MAG: hypothetical protein M3515_01145 [Actinomycetota bacterium]|nr:hypothetical protein [Actinomycetota bacterium]
MSPRPGGEADKFGNRFEGRWTVRQVLDVLAGRAVSITVEEVGEGGEGVEFSLVRNDGTVEAHQVKRQRGNANGWSVRNLEKENVLANATKQVELGRQFHFVSIIPSRKLDELADRARRSDDGQAFVNGLSAELGQEFNVFKAAVGSADYAFKVLRSLFMRMQDEREVRATNAVLAGRFIGGAPAPTAAVVLGDLVQEHLGCTMDLATIRGKLAEYELRPAELIGVAEVGETVRRVYEGWQGTIERELLDPEISRPEADEIGAALRSGGRTIVLAAGDAGAGKSAVLRQALSGLDDQWPVLGLRLDRIEPFSSPHELGVDRLGLPASPVASLAAVAGDNECLLVVDQLDAVSRASGRMPLTFDAVAELVREAAAFPSMRVLLACRQFDIDNDDRLRRLVTDEDKVIQVTVPTLSEEQVAGAVGAMGLAPAVLTGPQRELLGSPLHLVLLSAIADQDEALTFTSSKDLLDAFWDRKRQDCNARREVRFADTIGALVDYMSENQRLAAPEAILDAGELRGDADLLASEHVLVRDERKIAFFHEAFFDYAFARRWIIRSETLVEFLRSGEQELFRRAQVRQVLAHLRDDDPGRFIAEVDALLSDVEIRFHIKEVVLAIVRRIANPTTAEWRLVERLLNDDPPFAARLWSGLRTEAWFARLDAQGAIEQWLAGEETDLHARALEIMVSAPKQSAGRHAELIAPHVGRADFAGWLRWIVRFADLEQSRALFELVLDAVRTGRYTDSARELWLSAHSLGSKEPDWACELVAAWLRERPSALSLDDEGKIVALEDRDYQLQEIIKQAVAGAPGAFSRAVVPYLLAAMALTADGERRPRRDRHFGYRSWDSDPHDVGDALQLGARDALRALAAGDDAALDELLPMLASDEHDGAQWLLYEALIAAAPTRAEWAAQRLLEGEHRLASGYIAARTGRPASSWR